MKKFFMLRQNFICFLILGFSSCYFFLTTIFFFIFVVNIAQFCFSFLCIILILQNVFDV